MFKKFIITVATICTVATLTACGAGDKSSPNTLNKENNNADTNKEYVDSTLSSEYQESTASSSTEEKMIGIAYIRDVYEDNNEFLVTGTDDITYLINEDGHALAQTSRCIGYANGYFYSYNWLSDTEYGKWSIQLHNSHIYTIYDKNGDLVFDESSKILTPISKSGYMMTFDLIDELSGKSEKCQIVDINGNLVFEFGEGWFNEVGYISDDIFYYEENNGENIILYDAATNRKLEVKAGNMLSDYERRHNYRVHQGESELYDWIRIGDTYYSKDLSGQEKSFKGEILTDNTFWYENGIYDFDGNMVADLSEGKVSDTAWFNNVYYVKSGTDFIYTLDSNFQYIAEPKKIDGSSRLYHTTKGVLFSYEDCGIIDEYFNKIESLPDKSSLLGDNYVYYWSNEFEDSYCIYNLQTEKTIKGIIKD